MKCVQLDYPTSQACRNIYHGNKKGEVRYIILQALWPVDLELISKKKYFVPASLVVK
jgi:hypothetical protein